MQLLLMATALDLDRKMPLRTKAELRHHLAAVQETYRLRLDEFTSKAPHELTWDEFDWLVSRVILPIDESEQSCLRRNYLNHLVSERMWRVFRHMRGQTRIRFWPRNEHMQRMAYRRIVRRKLDWPPVAMLREIKAEQDSHHPFQRDTG